MLSQEIITNETKLRNFVVGILSNKSPRFERLKISLENTDFADSSVVNTRVVKTADELKEDYSDFFKNCVLKQKVIEQTRYDNFFPYALVHNYKKMSYRQDRQILLLTQRTLVSKNKILNSAGEGPRVDRASVKNPLTSFLVDNMFTNRTTVGNDLGYHPGRIFFETGVNEVLITSVNIPTTTDSDGVVYYDRRKFSDYLWLNSTKQQKIAALTSQRCCAISDALYASSCNLEFFNRCKKIMPEISRLKQIEESCFRFQTTKTKAKEEREKLEAKLAGYSKSFLTYSPTFSFINSSTEKLINKGFQQLNTGGVIMILENVCILQDLAENLDFLSASETDPEIRAAIDSTLYSYRKTAEIIFKDINDSHILEESKKYLQEKIKNPQQRDFFSGQLEEIEKISSQIERKIATTLSHDVTDAIDESIQTKRYVSISSVSIALEDTVEKERFDRLVEAKTNFEVTTEEHYVVCNTEPQIKDIHRIQRFETEQETAVRQQNEERIEMERYYQKICGTTAAIEALEDGVRKENARRINAEEIRNLQMKLGIAQTS
jgi:hypothetical protein